MRMPHDGERPVRAAEPQGADRPELAAADARLVRRMREASAPPALAERERAAFDARLHARMAELAPRRVWLPLSLGVGLAAAAAAALLVLRTAPAPAPLGPAASDPAREAFAAELLLEDGSGYRLVSEDEDDDDALPPQYAAIASMLE